MKRPLIFAHRGCEKWNAPASSELLKADYVELDIRKTIDDVLVISHGRSLKNSVRRVLVDTHKYDDLVKKTGRRLPKLEEVVEELRGKLLFNLDLHQQNLAKDIKKFIKHHNLSKEVIIDSSRHEDLQELSSFFPEAQFAYGFNYKDNLGLESYRVFRGIAYFSYFALFPFWPQLIKLVARRTPFVPAASIYYRIANKGVVDFFHSRDIPVYVWCVKEEEDMKRMIALGVDGIKTNKPGLLKKIIGK